MGVPTHTLQHFSLIHSLEFRWPLFLQMLRLVGIFRLVVFPELHSLMCCSIFTAMWRTDELGYSFKHLAPGYATKLINNLMKLLQAG